MNKAVFILGFALSGYVISSNQVSDLFDCLFACLEESRCQSFNLRLVPGQLHLCQLSNETMATKPENYQAQANMTYYDAGKVGNSYQKHERGLQ